jgi:hypothetical protein
MAAPQIAQLTPEAHAAAVITRPQVDLAAIRRTFDLMIPTPRIVEVRAILPRNRIDSGYFDADHRDEAARAAAKYNGRGGVYFVLNEINPALLALAHNRMNEYAKKTTADNDILRRYWLPIDLDPIRPAGISSSNAEHEAALARALEVREFLREQGWPQPMFADSGNGGHLNCRIDLPNNDASRDLIKRVLEALDLRFSDNVVKVDLTTYNAARIWKLYGAVACKGDHTPERPYRLSRVVA